MDDLVSVIIPFYNRTDLTLRALTSVLRQSYRNYEILLINDGSEESCAELEAMITSNESRCRYFSISRSGVSTARNVGILNSKGSLISFLDSDDEWEFTKLEKQVNWFISHPESQMVQCLENWIRDGEKVPYQANNFPASGNAFKRSLYICCISASAIMLRREKVLSVGLFDENLRVCEDYDYWNRCLVNSEIGLINQILVTKYRNTTHQLSNSELANDRFRLFSLLKLVQSLCLGPQLDQVLEAISSRLDILLKGAKKWNRIRDIQIYDNLESRIKNQGYLDPNILIDLLPTLDFRPRVMYDK